MKIVTSSLTLCLALALSSLAAADPKVYPQAKLQITFPEGWKVKDAQNGFTMAGAPGDDAGLIVFPVVGPTPEGVKKDVDGLVDHMHGTSVKWEDKLMKNNLNGMEAYARLGSATMDGKPHDLVCLLVLNGANGLVLVSVVQHDHKDSYKAALTATVASITATK